MTEPTFPDIELLLPHQAPMLLIDRVLSTQDDTISCEVVIKQDSIFFNESLNGIPSHVGIEYMAQTIGALAGLKAHKKGEQAPIGLLLGGRSYKDVGLTYPLGQKLVVSAKLTMSDESMGVYHAKIELDGEEVASSQVNAYVPSKDVLAQLTSAQ
ncbi:3-hydroxydecanoyl-ACP dehydratase [Shewanella maritima]|nr:3-hydroxydecanoyl-ACP dehydratase [Shewanella maritima]